MNKEDLSERDICTMFITPAIIAPGKWDLTTLVREEVSFTNCRILVRGKLVTRGNKLRRDYILYQSPNIVAELTGTTRDPRSTSLSSSSIPGTGRRGRPRKTA